MIDSPPVTSWLIQATSFSVPMRHARPSLTWVWGVDSGSTRQAYIGPNAAGSESQPNDELSPKRSRLSDQPDRRKRSSVRQLTLSLLRPISPVDAALSLHHRRVLRGDTPRAGVV